MSSNWVNDIRLMHEHFGVTDWMDDLKNETKFDEFLAFRLRFLQEELDETMKAWKEGDCEEIVDGLIDLCVVAIGTLDAFNIDSNKAWNNVLKANMSKNTGVNKTRPNALGLPDLIKPIDWEAPTHKENHGLLLAWRNISSLGEGT